MITLTDHVTSDQRINPRVSAVVPFIPTNVRERQAAMLVEMRARGISMLYGYTPPAFRKAANDPKV